MYVSYRLENDRYYFPEFLREHSAIYLQLFFFTEIRFLYFKLFIVQTNENLFDTVERSHESFMDE